MLLFFKMIMNIYLKLSRGFWKKLVLFIFNTIFNTASWNFYKFYKSYFSEKCNCYTLMRTVTVYRIIFQTGHFDIQENAVRAKFYSLNSVTIIIWIRRPKFQYQNNKTEPFTVMCLVKLYGCAGWKRSGPLLINLMPKKSHYHLLTCDLKQTHHFIS
jgi:hypothetical protein